MATFPLLKTNAVTQYPATKAVQFRNQALRFVDGAEQRYRDGASALHCWEIRLSELDESEMAALEGFFIQNQGRFGSFSFTDPWDGTVYSNCSVKGDDLTLEANAELQGRISLTVVENRN
ncbi:conserved hypothetical protein [Candidatus Sulfopaludibacter sp. SbA3]|nr:conserved hypothetical protein [Candidatus Sulfopaludibacter sp. SbA3]